jgi:predicted amidophosphoribosyltransferase
VTEPQRGSSPKRRTAEGGAARIVRPSECDRKGVVGGAYRAPVLTELLAPLRQLVLPMVCPGCGRPADPVCDDCASQLRPPPPGAPPPGIDDWAAAFAYDGVARELVARVKYRRAHGATAWLAAAMAPLVAPPIGTVVTWAPTTPERRRERGFDHAELLARRVARRLARPSRALLGRGPGPAQTGLPAAARRAGPTFVPRSRAPASVLVVDDVATTGATLGAAAAALRAAGAIHVAALTAARTPPPGSRDGTRFRSYTPAQHPRRTEGRAWR